MSARRHSSRKHCRRASAAQGADRIVRADVCPLPEACVELLERRLAGAKLFLAKGVERRLDRAQMRVQVFRILLDIEQAGDDLPLGGVVLQKSERGGAVVQLVIGIELTQRQLGTVMLLDNFDGARLIFNFDRHAAGDEVEPVHRLIVLAHEIEALDRKSTRLNSSHMSISYA